MGVHSLSLSLRTAVRSGLINPDLQRGERAGSSDCPWGEWWVCQCVCLCVSLSVRVCLCRCLHVCVCLSVPVCVFVCLSVPVHVLRVYLSEYERLYLSVSVYV